MLPASFLWCPMWWGRWGACLVDDACSGRHDGQVLERLGAPLEELEALLVAFKLNLRVLLGGAGDARVVHLHRVVNHQVHRHLHAQPQPKQTLSLSCARRARARGRGKGEGEPMIGRQLIVTQDDLT